MVNARLRPSLNWAILAGLCLGTACAPVPAPLGKCPDTSLGGKISALTSHASHAVAVIPGAEAGNQALRFTITLKPVAEPATVVVDILASGPGTSLQSWTIRAPAENALRSVSASDMDGTIAATAEPDPAQKPAALSIELSRPPRGPLRLSYVLSGAPLSLSATPLVEVDPDLFRATGQSLLALPDDLADNKIVPVHILIDKSEYNAGTSSAGAFEGATSYGIGADTQVKTSAQKLRDSAFFLGRLGTGVFDAYEGRDVAVWFGHTAFDPRPIAADVAGFRTAVGQIFKDAFPLAPATFFILPDARRIGAFSAHRQAGGVVLQISLAEPWSGAVRIAVGTEVVKAYVGERLWIGVPDKPAQSHWFSEGLTRAFARELLFRFGLLLPSELISEINGLIGTLVTSPLRHENNAALSEKANEAGVLPVLVARGALYATRVDALLRAKPGAKQSLQQVLLSLYAKAAEKQGPLPTSAWVEALAQALDAKEADAFKAMIENGGDITLPADAFGPCFQVGPHSYEPFELGYESADVEGEEDARVIKRVKSGGAADKAGLRAGDRLLEEHVTAGAVDVPVKLKIRRGNEEKAISFRPAGPSIRAQGVSRKKNVPDEECVP